MLVEVTAGAFFLAGAVACAAAGLRGRARSARVALALATAGAGPLAGAPEWAAIAALAAAAAALLVRARFGAVDRLSWLDAAMGAAAAAGVAVAVGAETLEAVGAGGVAGGLALCRWRPAWSVCSRSPPSPR